MAIKVQLVHVCNCMGAPLAQGCQCRLTTAIEVDPRTRYSYSLTTHVWFLPRLTTSFTESKEPDDRPILPCKGQTSSHWNFENSWFPIQRWLHGTVSWWNHQLEGSRSENEALVFEKHKSTDFDTVNISIWIFLDTTTLVRPTKAIMAPK